MLQQNARRLVSIRPGYSSIKVAGEARGELGIPQMYISESTTIRHEREVLCFVDLRLIRQFRCMKGKTRNVVCIS